MSKVSMNLQDSFLNQVRKENAEVKLILLDGTTLSGVIKGFDNFTVILGSRGAQHLIYKHAIAQMIWRRPAGRKEQEGEELNSRKSEGFNRLDLSQIKIETASGGS
jgi:host factor-I protein